MGRIMLPSWQLAALLANKKGMNETGNANSFHGRRQNRKKNMMEYTDGDKKLCKTMSNAS